jgi:large subunit ribosomal protein L6
MSRIGKMPIELPKDVEVKLDQNHLVVKGPKGQLEQDLHKDIIVTVEENQIVVTRPSDEKNHRALHGLTRALIANMVAGVTKGYQRSLDLVGVGYRAQKQGKKLVLTVGYSHPVELEEPAGITIDVPAQNKILVSGINKQAVGNFAAKIRSVREPEPYLGKGIKYTEEVIRRKEGKTGKK